MSGAEKGPFSVSSVSLPIMKMAKLQETVSSFSFGEKIGREENSETRSDLGREKLSGEEGKRASISPGCARLGHLRVIRAPGLLLSS